MRKYKIRKSVAIFRRINTSTINKIHSKRDNDITKENLSSRTVTFAYEYTYTYTGRLDLD